MPNPRTVSVERIITIGKFLGMGPLIILCLGSLLGGMIYVAIHNYSFWWMIPILIFSLVVPGAIYYATLTKWRIWAYENVVNVSELELSKDSYPFLSIAESTPFPLTQRDRQRLKEIEEMIKQPSGFTDDVEVAEETTVHYSKTIAFLQLIFYTGIFVGIGYLDYTMTKDRDFYQEAFEPGIFITIVALGIVSYFAYRAIKRLTRNEPIIIINNQGIRSDESEFINWKEITDAAVVYCWAGGRSTPYYMFKYSTDWKEHAIKVKYFDISPLGLQHLVYIHRGRSVSAQQQMAKGASSRMSI